MQDAYFYPMNVLLTSN